MNIFLICLTFVLLVSLAEGRVRRQAWPRPQQQRFPQERRTFLFPNPSFNNNNYNFDLPDNSGLKGPDRFTRPPTGGQTSEGRPESSENQNGGNQNGGNQNVGNQNGSDRTTTTPAPRRIHVSPPNCPCPSTPQFNPVCGTDGNTYKNAGLLNCYRQCGTDVSQRRLGVC